MEVGGVNSVHRFQLTLDRVPSFRVRESTAFIHSPFLPSVPYAKTETIGSASRDTREASHRFPFLSFEKLICPFAEGGERGGKRGKKNDPSLPRSPPIIHRFSRPFLFSRSPPRARGGVATIGRTDARRAERGPTEQQPDWERQSALRLRRVHILLSRSRSATGGTR